MNTCTLIREDLARIIIPYKDIDTTVYLLRTPQGMVLFDTASSDEDMEQYLRPAVEELNWSLDDLRYIFISHNHRDHARGLGWVTKTAQEAMVVSRCPKIYEDYPGRGICPEDGDSLLDVLRVVTIPGHTADSAALLDTRDGTLITGDCLQLFGIFGSGLWGANITLPAEHFQAIEKVRAMDVKTILCAHEYHPLGRVISGRSVAAALDACVEPLMWIRQLIVNHPELDDEQIVARYHEDVYLPTVPPKVAAAMRRALEEGAIAR